ncbi:protein of unknown function [Chitinophaga sp. CF118]|uniref:DUF4249 domain-containing protein n=1 Tax=Chitinophaga sp. CF118 TaxID=1884367 RepID=UPI0008E64DC7|nr:DUF4249 domain-containing protein [Chitinophaga sp. CF118]SFD18724.1 protein of unknown function [Chitinophaga sp. CF118]
MVRTYLVYVVLLILLCAGCQKESKINIPYEGDKIVLNSLIQPDSLIYIRATLSKPVRESGNLQFPELKGAAVTLEEDGVALPAPHWQVINGHGYYVSESVALKGKKYTIGVTYKGLDSVTAIDSTPARPVIKDVHAQANTNRIRFTLIDNAAETNYYRIRFYKADSINGELVKNKKDTIKCRPDPSFTNSFIDIIGDAYYSDIIISDVLLNGKEAIFIMQTEKDISVSPHLIIEVCGLTKGAYKYLLAANDQWQDDDIDFVLNPVNIYSNVQNGYGIVAGINATVLNFNIE